MPRVNTGRSNVSQAGKTAGKKKVRKAEPVAGPPAPKRVTVVAPADRVQERATVRTQQLKKSVKKAGDAPQNRAGDQRKAEGSVKKQYAKAGRGSKSLYKPGTTVPPDIAMRSAISVASKRQKSTAAPALKVLEQTTRVNHAIASGVRQNVRAIKKQGPGALLNPVAQVQTAKAALRGAQNKDKSTFSDVLGEAGWNPKSGLGKVAKSAVGFTLDVGTDPSTYVTLGSGTVAQVAAKQAAKDAAKRSAKAGLGKDQSARMVERAASHAEKRADQTRGATVKVAGRELPGVRKATAAASKPVRAAGRKVVPQKVRDGMRAAGADVNPDIAPAGVSRETSRKAVQATRTARAKSDRGLHEAQQHAIGIKRSVGEANYGRVIDAIENGTIGKLPPELRDVAVRVRSQFRYANRQRKHAGIRGGEVGGKKGRGGVKEYIPHHLTDEAVEAEEKAARGGTGRKVIRPTSSRARSNNKPLSELRKEQPGRYSEDLPNLYASRKAEGATSVARAELNRRVADLGRTVKKGRDITLERGESVYHILGSDIRKVPSKEAADVAEKGGKNGRYVVLNDDVVKRAVEGAQPTLEGPGLVRGYDKIQSAFKRVALATPGFHVRNLVGDTQNAYLGQAGHRIPKNMVQAGRVLKAEGRKDKSLRALGQGKTGTGTVKTGRYGDVTYDEVAEQLTKHGAMRTGYTARELPELSGKTARAGRVRAPRNVKQALLNREDLPRVTTALDALKKGATWEEAAQRVADYHFDYGHLTRFERNVGRRIAPFYTFTARNVPLQVKTLVTKPGKFANYEKLREEASKLAGMDEESQKARDLTDKLKQAGVKLPDGWESNLSEWEQRNVGVPVKWKGKTFTVSMGLPLADLNEVPGAALGDQINEYYQKGMSLAGPLPKNVIEYMENHSFFFRGDIERPNAPLVAAPGWVRMLPAGLKRQMGVTENYVDKKTGEKALAYRAKADYIIKSIPGTPAFLNKLATDGHDRVGKGPAGKTLAFAGVKATPFDPVSNAVNLAYDRLEEIDKQKSVLNQQGVNAKHPTAAYVKLLQQEKLLNSLAFQGRRDQGYKVLPATGGPPKNRSGAGRVRLPGVGGRVKVPGSSSGRVKVP